MHRVTTSLVICSLTLLLIASPATAENDAGSLFDQAKASLEKADFDGAAALMEKAAAADPDNQEYAQELRLLQRVMKIRSRLDMQAAPEKWEKTARSLRSYYYTNKIYSEALVIDQACYEKLKDADTASRVGKTMLTMEKNEDAAAFLDALPAELKSDRSEVLRGIACARLGKTDDAGKIAAAMTDMKEPSPVQCYERACLSSLVSQQAAAAKMLVQAFESTPQSRLDEFKQYVKDSTDLAAFYKTPMVAKVMETKSKVVESKCSGGSSCGSCPSRGGCSKDSSSESCKDKKADEKAGGTCASEKKE